MNPAAVAATRSHSTTFYTFGATPEEDASDMLAATARHFHDSETILASIKTFDLPDIGLPARPESNSPGDSSNRARQLQTHP
jgi:hypothetical protein